jgi:hypothetical protein
MKKVAYLAIVLVLLVAFTVPAMAKSPKNNGNGNGGGHGNGNSGVAQGNQANHGNQNNHGNSGVKGNGTQGRTHPNTPFYLQGTISSVVVETQTISVTLTHGNAMVKQFLGEDLAIKVTAATQIFKITQGVEGEAGEGESETPEGSSSESATNDEGVGNRVPIPFNQLAVGQYVAIHGNLMDEVYTARLITVYIRTPVGETVGEPVGEQP